MLSQGQKTFSVPVWALGLRNRPPVPGPQSTRMLAACRPGQGRPAAVTVTGMMSRAASITMPVGLGRQQDGPAVTLGGQALRRLRPWIKRE